MSVDDPIIGIDLGTTNSCAAFADPESGEISLIPYRAGDHTIPSVFAVDSKGQELVGYEALRQWQLNPKNTIYGAKRLIGLSTDDSITSKLRERVTYEFEDDGKGSLCIKVGDSTLSLEEISAKILTKIREVASDHLGTPVKRAVVTVPAYYNDRQRQSVRRAGDLADLEIVRIINEPTAASLAYGARKELHKTLAVYDLGGGTFDMSVIGIEGRTFKVKSTGGDVFLGGIDFDNAIVSFVLSEFNAQQDIDLSTDPIAMQRIRDMAEQVKIDLSSRTEIPLSIPFIAMSPDGQPLDLNLVMKRDELEALVLHLCDQTFDTCTQVIDDAGITTAEIDEILLVGGQTRMPLIQERIERFFGASPSKGVHADEAVAIGAALFGWSLREDNDLRFQLHDVLPMAIGIETAHGALHQLFPRNAPVPDQRAFNFTTHKDNQPDLVMRIFQGDKPVSHENTLLGEFTFSGLREGAAGSVRVEVNFSLSAEGILTLNARDQDTQTEMTQTVRLS